MRKIKGWSEKDYRMITCTVTGKMSDGTKIWTECDENRKPVNDDWHYRLETRNGFNDFWPL